MAYESLLKQRRQSIHGRIAKAIEELYAERLDEHYELLANHYERSGNVEKAVHYLLLAGEKSNQRNAVHSASEFFQKAIELADSSTFHLVPEIEMRLHYGLAHAFASIGGSSDENLVKRMKKAIKHSQDLGMNEYERKCYYTLGHNTVAWHNQKEAKQILSEGLVRARDLGEKTFESQMLSFTALNACAFRSIRKGYEIAIDAEKIAFEAGDRFSILFARMQRSYSERWLGRAEKSIEFTEGVVGLSQKVGNLAMASIIIGSRGTALVEIGRIEEGIELLNSGIELDEKHGGFFKYALKFNTLGYCYSELHQHEKALELNLRSEEIARGLFNKYPNGRLNHAEMIAQANINVFENLFDQGKWIQLGIT